LTNIIQDLKKNNIREKYDMTPSKQDVSSEKYDMTPSKQDVSSKRLKALEGGLAFLCSINPLLTRA